ncbi:uncharacterized protein Dwil_GK14824 [Drosophila willistoni]|uniref:Protein amnionless n=1 Tax=Drosophila willistoni TaxID=7260 RepID=B4MWJ8_DROWI|nr:protein amnionless [Drosophila willistoni]EDW76139.1 uncharacterized protein Dwil_GK14824 [Drosophila willistoni]
MMKLLSFFAVCLSFHLNVVLATKFYRENLGFNQPSFWVEDYKPCQMDVMVFPEHYPAVLSLPQNISSGGFILPLDGAILMNEEATIQLSAGQDQRHKDASCESDEGHAYLQSPTIRKWFDPNTWSAVAGGSPLASPMPELERIPCDDEPVIIRGTGSLSFDLENIEDLRMGQLFLAGSSISKMYLEELLTRDLGQLLFHNAENVRVEYYRGELCGCHKNFDRLIEPVCHNVEEQCEPPHCLSPVLPYGSCCFICGAIMTTPSSYCPEADRKSLLDYLNQYSDDENVNVYVDYVGSDNFGNFLQTIITDRGVFHGQSVDFMQRLLEHHNDSQVVAKYASESRFKYAGNPHNPNVSFASVLLILFCMALVGVVAIIMLAHYMPENPYLNRIPQWIHDPRRWRWHHLGLRLRRQLQFNRLDNSGSRRGVSGVEPLSVLSYDAESGVVRERAFDNPMFEQEPTQHRTQEEVGGMGGAMTEDSMHKSEMRPAPKVETGELDNCSLDAEEQELAEINLDSSEAESEGEAETKE